MDFTLVYIIHNSQVVSKLKLFKLKFFLLEYLKVICYNTNMDLSAVKITEKKREILSQMHIESVEKLLQHFPFRYEFRYEKPFVEWESDEMVYFSALIVDKPVVHRYGYNKSTLRLKVLVDNELVELLMFNRFFTNGLTINNTISVMGKYNGKHQVMVTNYSQKPLKELLGIIPIYHTKKGMNANDWKKYITRALDVYEFHNFIPKKYQEAYQLMNLQEAYNHIHLPTNKLLLKKALRTLKYQEALQFQLLMQYQFYDPLIQKQAKKLDVNYIKSFIKGLPYALTKGQKSALEDIANDLTSSQISRRLIQGDVGCGKTLVAIVSLVMNYTANYQGALMAPTEILAIQHFKTMQTLLENEKINIALLTSSSKDKKEIIAKLANGEIDIVVGTHSIIQKEVEFNNLGLVIADEQHRFGVEQRQALIKKGNDVDMLLMSATPIPRTLAFSKSGNLKLSTIDSLPNNRKGVITQLIKENSLRSIEDKMAAYLNKQGKVYIVAPSVENLKTRNVESLYHNLSKHFEGQFKVGLLHGKMRSDEKSAVMKQFVDGEIQILISTTVIEVGVDVNGADMMIIYDSDRFGMNQIHQLRGRVGRHEHQGYCYLLTSSKDEDTLKRLAFLADCNDGFSIAEKDLELRGPGELLGDKQSGSETFALIDWLNDENVLTQASKDAGEIINNLKEYPNLYAFLEQEKTKQKID